MATLLDRLSPHAIYLTIDKDVLTPEYALTNWDQGQMPLTFLLQAVRYLAQRTNILGIDVVGDYSQPHYTGSWFSTLLKRAESWYDQPRSPPNLTVAAQCNSATNQTLLSLFLDCLP
jgi:hypothetical protein